MRSSSGVSPRAASRRTSSPGDPMTISHPRPDGEPYRTGNGDRLLAALITIGLAGVLLRVSSLNFGVLIAPGVAAGLLVGVLAIRRTRASGQARAVLSGVAVGLSGLVLLSFLLALILFAALSNRPE